jgi:hypothetical protein
VKRFIIMMARTHGGLAWMAEEYHGDGDVDGPLRKIGNASITDVNEQKACYAGREMEDLEVTRVRGRMMSW